MVRLIEAVRTLAVEAGDLILSLRDMSLANVQFKVDKSPITEADLAANEHIVKGLNSLKVGPVISEEGENSGATGNRFWLVDPLDGTKDFIAGKRSFCINIALIEDKRPVLGVIYAPMLQEIFWAEAGQGAYKVSMPGPKKQIYNRSDRTEYRVLASGSHMSSRMGSFLETFPMKSLERFGSALKMCRVAEGAADLYPRFGETHEWDTAAGHVILYEAGCKLISLDTGRELEYGKHDFRNGGFLASRNDLDLWSTMRSLRS